MTLHIFGYPRSGNHYLGAVVRANDLVPLERVRYGPERSSHSWPPALFEDLLGADNHLLYIWRSFDAIAPSMLAKEQASGMIVGTLSVPQFSNTPWSELIEEGHVKVQFLNRWVPKDRWHTTPYECWKNHVHTWLSLAESRTDVHSVSYDDICYRFQDTMSYIAQWLGSDRTDFVDVTKKVDPAPVRKGGFQGA